MAWDFSMSKNVMSPPQQLENVKVVMELTDKQLRLFIQQIVFNVKAWFATQGIWLKHQMGTTQRILKISALEGLNVIQLHLTFQKPNLLTM